MTISARTKIRFVWNNGELSAWESYVRAKFKYRLVAIAFICCAVSVAMWFSVQWWPEHYPQDYEQCSEKAQRTASSEDKRISLMAQCDKQFVGRRKIGGGYTYYDFLQNRHFDIAGPNPTPNELKHFDEEYTLYLDTQRRDAVAAAKRRCGERDGLESYAASALYTTLASLCLRNPLSDRPSLFATSRIGPNQTRSCNCC